MTHGVNEVKRMALCCTICGVAKTRKEIQVLITITNTHNMYYSLLLNTYYWHVCFKEEKVSRR